jgi:hypothetical protein
MKLYFGRLATLALSGAIGHAAVSSASAASATASGPSALALAAIVASDGSLLSSFDRRALISLFDGKSVIIPRVNKITVAADSIACKMSDVDITARSCDLVFKGKKRVLTGRNANEVFGTLAIAGVASEGAAGSITASIMKLECTIDPMVIKQKAGGGADCTFETGQ